jgi:hypothetical protein
MRVFIAGIMQGSRRDDGVDDQGYRQQIAAVLRRHAPGVETVDPWELFPDSPGYTYEQGKQVFISLCEEAARVDTLVAYAPEASMGTAIEMWQAYLAGAAIYCISPLTANWVVRFLSKQVFPSIEAFEAFVAEGGLDGVESNKSKVQGKRPQ